MKASSARAQGTIEYLVIIAIVVVIALVVVGLLTGFLGGSTEISSTTQQIGAMTGPISVTESVADPNGDALITLGNNSGESVTVTKITSSDSNNSFSETIPQGSETTFSLSDLGASCECAGATGTKECTFTIYTTSQYGVQKTESIKVSVQCVSDAQPTNPETVAGLGLGTPSSPYTINSFSELEGVADNPSASYALGGDIDASSTRTMDYNAASGEYMGFLPIGWGPDSISGTADDYNFAGTLDGAGHKITGLYINRTASPTDSQCGLFLRLESGATIENLVLENVDINCFSAAGALLVYNYGLVENVSMSGNVAGAGYVGGLVTLNYGTVRDSFSSGTLTGWTRPELAEGDTFGGLIGYNSGPVEGCGSSMNINAFTHLGGLIGNSNGAATNLYVKDSYATGNVSGTNIAGGLIGLSIGDVNNCYATGNVTLSCTNAIGECGAGGLIAYEGGTISRSYATGNVTETLTHAYSQNGSSGIGGLLGSGNAGRIIDSFATGDVNGINRVGGLAGHLATYDGDITPRAVNSFATGKVTFNQGTELHSGRMVGELSSYPTGASINTLSNEYFYVNPANSIAACYHNYHNGLAYPCTANILSTDSGAWGAGVQYFQGSDVSAREPMASWSDFSNNWTAVAGGYPKLKWQD